MTPPTPTGTVPTHAHGRKATWFELFFDLVFVVAVAQLSGAYAHHYDWGGALVFAFAFLAMWWCWLGHTFFSTRFDEDKPSQRLIGMLMVLAIAWLGYGASDVTGERAWVFATGIAAFKLLLAASYLACWRWRGARGLILAYASLYLLQAALWLGSTAAPGPLRTTLWAVALLLDMASPWWVARHTHQVPPHPEHLPERFGLFTIILLGEGMASVVHALDHGGSPGAGTLAVALGGAVLSFMIWIGYFDLTRAQRERHVADPRGGRALRLWAYSHVALYLGIASLAAGTVHLSGQASLDATSRQLFSIGIALAMVGSSLLGVASRAADGASPWPRGALHLGIALAFALAMWVVDLPHPGWLMAVAAAVCGIQLLLARSGTRGPVRPD